MQQCTMAKFQWEVWHLHFIENFQLCLSFYPRPNISDRFVSLASHFIRVQIFQIHLWGTKWTVVNHAYFYCRREALLSIIIITKILRESESELINGIFGHSAALKKRWDICKTIFSDFGCNFLLLAGVFHKCSKSKYHSIQQYNFFGTHFVCEKHPLHVFFFFPLFACIDLLKLFHLPIFGELRKLHAK